MNLKRLHLKCNIKSLIAESRLLRETAKKTKIRSAKNSLHIHRVVDVRRALRVANLAYACIRGIPYDQLESKTSLPKHPNDRLCFVDKLLNDVKSKACKFSEREERESINDWLKDARSNLLAA